VSARRVSPSLAVAVLAVAFLASALAVRIVFAGKSPGSILRRAPPDLSAFDAAIERAARESGVDPNLVRALCAAESGGNPRARSDKDARGLLQLTPGTAVEEAKRIGAPTPSASDLFEPAVNVRLGTSYLARLLKQFDGEEAFAIAAYNAGPTPVKRWRARAPDVDALNAILREGYAQTRNHVTRVLRFRDEYASR
jgi:soluble lytic murein transglycosylase